VADLVAADFEIEEGGRKTAVVAFQSVDVGGPTASTTTGASSPPVEAASRRQFLLLFDLAYSTPGGLNRARAAALDFVGRSLGPRDLAALAVIGGTGPRLLVGFTGDSAQLRQAITGMGLARANRIVDPLALAWDLNIAVRETALGLEFESEEERDRMFQLMRSEREAYSRRVEDYVAGLDSLARLLDAVSGHKQVLLFSAGFDQSVVGGSQGAERQEAARAVAESRLWEVQSDAYFGDASARGRLDELFRRLGASDAVIHSVDIGGLEAGADVADATRTQVGRGRESLAQIASGSGGMFLKDVNDVGGALRDIMDASRHFYVLGFAPGDEGKPGRFRKLSVKVKRPGLKVSHRAGYLVPDPKATPDPNVARLQAADAIAKGLSGGAFGLHVLAVPIEPPAAATTRQLPVALQVDGETLLEGVKDDKLGLEVYAYVLDTQGRILDALSATPVLDLAKVRGSLRDKGLQLLTVFRAPKGTADLRFLVRHPPSGRMASYRLLSPESQSAWPVTSPLVTTDPGSRVVVPVASRANPQLDLPFRVGARPFAPEILPVLKNGVSIEVCLMARPPRGPSLEVMADLVSGEGKTHALASTGPIKMVKDRDGAFRVVMNLSPEAITPGSYDLRITLRDETGEEVRSTQVVAVR
jgi:VWFA-related protein